MDKANKFSISSYPDGWGGDIFDVMNGDEQLCTCEKKESAELIIKALIQMEESKQVQIGSYIYSVEGRSDIVVRTPNGRKVDRGFSVYAKIKEVVSIDTDGINLIAFDGKNKFVFGVDGKYLQQLKYGHSS